MRSVLVFTACLMAAAPVVPAHGWVDEQFARAAALVNVAKFVEWPEGWLSGPFQIAVAADEDFATILTTVTRNSRLHDREIRVRRLDDDDEDCRCHLLFVSAPEDRRAALLLRGARSNYVLTIGETTAFLREGGIVRRGEIAIIKKD